MLMTIDPKRLDQVMSWSLTPGIHDENADGEDAAAYAAWDAAVKVLAPTVESLQPNAVDLVGRLIDVR